MSDLTSSAVIINKPISGQIVGGWLVTISPTAGRINYGPFDTQDAAIQFASQFDFAEVSPVYWPTTSRG